MAVKENLRNNLLEKVFRPLKFCEERRTNRNVLVVDSFSANLLSYCFAMHELFEEGVILVESLTKNREPLTKNDAIYLCSSTPNSIDQIIADFASSKRKIYKSAHIYFVDTCSDSLFEKLSKSTSSKYILTIKELHISFIPIENQAFLTKGSDVNIMATNIACFCANLGVYPVLRYKSDFAHSAEICYRVEQSLDELMKFDKRLGLESDSDLVIVDRSFDLLSPLLHELTLQAMITDLLKIQNNTYTYKTDKGVEKQVILDERDPLWVEMRHEHIAVVLEKVCERTKQAIHQSKFFATSSEEPQSIRNIGETIKRLPSHQRKVEKLSAYVSLSEELMEKFNQGMNEVCVLEQDMATGFSVEGVPIRDVIIMRRLSCLILPAVPVETRLRLILIYMLCMDNSNTKNEEHYRKILELTDIPEEEYRVVFEMYRKMKRTMDFRSERKSSKDYIHKFATSRFVPRLSQVINDVIERKLDESKYLYLGKKPRSAVDKKKTDTKLPKSARFGCNKNFGIEIEKKNTVKRKIIVYIVGGMTCSEIRAVHESMRKNEDCDVFIGSDEILTPSSFIESFQ